VSHQTHTNNKQLRTMPSTNDLYESFKRRFVNTCHHTAFAKTPYPWQQTNVGSLIVAYQFANLALKLLLVRPTGGGKTLVFTSAAACIKGITICITPLLLSLGANQVQKIMSKTSETDNSVVGFHLDELTDAKLLELRIYMSTLTSNTNKTIILFSSPQLIVS
jgi:superfamily II DNA or RNA helicase